MALSRHAWRVAAVMLVATAVSGTASAQDVPAAVAAPGYMTVLSTHAVGGQIYQCVKGADGKLAWKGREPIAALMVNGKTVGRHYAGPKWADDDGSVILAKSVSSAPGKSAKDVAWLKLEVTGHEGKQGVLSDVAYVQRLDTHGGAAKGKCRKAGAIRNVPYTATYVFLKKGS